MVVRRRQLPRDRRALALAHAALVSLLCGSALGACEQAPAPSVAQPPSSVSGAHTPPPARLAPPTDAQRELAEQGATRELARTGPMSDLRRDALLSLARASERDGDGATARRFYTTLHDDAPPNADVELGLGRLYWEQRELEPALAAWSRAGRIDADRVDAHQVLEAAYREFDRHADGDAARLAYERAVVRLAHRIDHSDDPDARRDAIARLRRSTPDPDAARALIRALDDDAFRVRVEALEALVEVATHDVVPLLERHREADAEGRFTALFASAIEAAEARRPAPIEE